MAENVEEEVQRRFALLQEIQSLLSEPVPPLSPPANASPLEARQPADLPAPAPTTHEILPELAARLQRLEQTLEAFGKEQSQLRAQLREQREPSKLGDAVAKLTTRTDEHAKSFDTSLQWMKRSTAELGTRIDALERPKANLNPVLIGLFALVLLAGIVAGAMAAIYSPQLVSYLPGPVAEFLQWNNLLPRQPSASSQAATPQDKIALAPAAPPAASLAATSGPDVGSGANTASSQAAPAEMAESLPASPQSVKQNASPALPGAVAAPAAPPPTQTAAGSTETVAEPALAASPSTQAAAGSAEPVPEPAPAANEASQANPITPIAPAVTPVASAPLKPPPETEAGPASLSAPTSPPVVAPPAGTGGAAPSPAEKSGRIVLRAKSDIWVQVRDRHGKVVLDRVFRAGETWAVPDEPQLLLSTGNAGATELLVDGIAAPPLGQYGSVRADIPLDPELIRTGKAVPLSGNGRAKTAYRHRKG
jgi:Domain of unknown function (DUF4115)